MSNLEKSLVYLLTLIFLAAEVVFGVLIFSAVLNPNLYATGIIGMFLYGAGVLLYLWAVVNTLLTFQRVLKFVRKVK